MSGSSDLLKSENWYLGKGFELASQLTKSWEHPPRFIITANLETISICNKNSDFLKVCEGADILIPDGIGSVILLKRFKRNPFERIPGIELAENILKTSKNQTKIFLFGAEENVLSKAKISIERRFPNIQITGYKSGFNFDTNKTINDINKSDAEILFVALGMPAQEFWISENLNRLKNIKLVIGVGGAFDVWSGTKKRAPVWICKIGMEWMWRVFAQPFVRIPRLLKSLAVFIPLMLKGR